MWLVDLDSSKVVPPSFHEELPLLPEPETSILKNHLRQVRSCHPATPATTTGLTYGAVSDTKAAPCYRARSFRMFFRSLLSYLSHSWYGDCFTLIVF